MNSASAPDRVLAYVMESAPEEITAQEHERSPGKLLTDAMLRSAKIASARRDPARSCIRPLDADAENHASMRVRHSES